METNYTQEVGPMPYGREGHMGRQFNHKGEIEINTPLAIALLVTMGVVAIVVFVLWLKMLVNAIVRPMDNTQKILWVAVMLVTHWVGALVYYFVVYRNKALPAVASQPAVPATSVEGNIPPTPKA